MIRATAPTLRARPATGRPTRPGRAAASHPVLGWQRTAGNRAVVQLLAAQAAPATPAAAGATPPLTSPRFAGDAVLEACHQDRARLAQGATGEPVRKVQQALVDLGFDLGPKGADSSFGPRTAAAVRAFKAREALGFEQFGDVGPGTMSRLDQLFPGPAPTPTEGPPEATEEDGLSCPVDDDVVTAVEADPALAEPLQRNALRAEQDAVGDSGPVGDPAAAPPLPGGIAAAVDRFKKLVNAKDATGAQAPGPNVSTFGQFFVFGKVREAVDAEIARIGAAADSDAKAFAAKAAAAMSAISSRSKNANKLIGECDAIAAATSSPEKAAMQALLRPGGAGGSIDATLFAAFDLSPNDAIPPATLAKFRSLRAAKAVLGFDSSACGGHALRVAARLARKGGIVPPKPKPASVAQQLSTGTGFEDLRPMGSTSSANEPAATAAVNPASPASFGDVVNQTGTAGVVGQMRAVLDSGRTVHARVVSGLGYGVGTTATGKTAPDIKAKRIPIGAPPEEHSLLVIGSDGGTAFVFHDPDAAVSHTPEAGFGMLFLDSDGRLSTAETPGDLGVDQDGKHARGDKRYQIIRVQSV